MPELVVLHFLGLPGAISLEPVYLLHMHLYTYIHIHTRTSMHIHIHVYVYTGLADTMGQEPVRHLVADRIVAPPEHRALFAEHLILLHTYHFYSVRGNRFAGDGIEAGSHGNSYALAHRHGPPSVCVCFA